MVGYSIPESAPCLIARAHAVAIADLDAVSGIFSPWPSGPMRCAVAGAN
jgi:hypothetical protein